jgi:hypothetical protein
MTSSTRRSTRRSTRGSTSRSVAVVAIGLLACSRDHASSTTASSPAAAPAPSLSSNPTLDSRLAPIAFFVGDWTAKAENPSTKQAFSLRYRVTPVLGGSWLEGSGVAKELGLEIRDYWGIDASGEITRTLFDSSGVTGTVRSKGWSGDSLVLEGTINTGMRVRETISKRGE